MAEWKTRRTQNPLGESPWGFESPSRYETGGGSWRRAIDATVCGAYTDMSPTAPPPMQAVPRWKGADSTCNDCADLTPRTLEAKSQHS